MHARDGASGCLAVGRAPGLPEPLGRVDAGGVLRRDHCLAFARDPAEHGVGEPAGEAFGAARQGHRLGHRGVRRSLEKQELRRAEAEDVPNSDGLRRRAQKAIEQGVDLPEPAQGGRQQQSGEGAIAGGQGAEPRMAGEGLIERALLAQDPVEHVERQPARADRGRHGARAGAQAAGWSRRRPSRTCRISAVVSAGP